MNGAGLPGHGFTAVALLHLHGPQLVPDGEPAEQRLQREAHRESPPRRRQGHRARSLAQHRQERRRGPPRQVGGLLHFGQNLAQQKLAQYATLLLQQQIGFATVLTSEL